MIQAPLHCLPDGAHCPSLAVGPQGGVRSGQVKPWVQG